MFSALLKGKSLLPFIWMLLALAMQLSAQPPAGYYDSATGTGVTLKTQLYHIIKNHSVRSYDQLWTDFQSTDAKSNGKVWDIYSDIPSGTPAYEYNFLTNRCGNYNSEGDCYNREHSFPASWFNDASPMYSDLFHVYPTDGYVNNRRSNYPYGQVGTATWTSTNSSKLGLSNYPGYSGVVFEPRNDFKGDLARTYFYMVTRYENVVTNWNSPMLNKTTYPSFSNWALSLLLQWHQQDPVSQKEIDRNNAIYALQGNRNPFIDNPNYALMIWGSGASLADEPQAHATDFSGSTISLQWTESAGTYLPDGYLIRMSSTGFDQIAAPTDGVPVTNDFSNKNVSYGVGQAVFGGLTSGQTYYFKIFPYAGSGSQIDYKTDGAVRQVSIVAQ
ncbi:MAG: endonuclease [Bacteroidetes bacterium]|nr:endonuclease [Bacteroidota bacterium]